MPKSKKVEKVEIEKAPVSGEKHSVPTMGERRGPSGVIARHRRKITPNTPKVKDSERPVIELLSTTKDKFVEFACIKEIFDFVEAKKSNQQQEVSAEIWERFIDMLWTSKCQPANPNIQAKTADGKVDATGQFIVASGERMQIDMPECREDEEPEDALARGLVAAGVSPHNAERIVRGESSEVSFVPIWSLNFTDLIRGEIKDGKIHEPSPAQYTAAETLFCAINGEDLDGNPIDDKARIELLKGISSEGWNALKSDVEKRTTYPPKLANSQDFLDRVCRYADSREELAAILTVIKPLKYCQRVVFAPSDSAEGKDSRMISKAKSIIAEKEKKRK